ncbi:hypothetical protein JW978_02060 [Candidatus Dojkabacteria bacterium]|nr:hypothetical protein [Candidatus Dojkabacteria bacterium]
MLAQPEALTYIPIQNIEELERLARGYEEYRDNIRLCPGMHMPKSIGEPIDGTYGLQLVDKRGESEVAVAHMGFNINGPVLEITQTPTGESPDHLSARLRRYLSNSDFRRRLMGSALSIAEQLGLETVVGHSLKTHPTMQFKIENEEITEEQARKVLDDLYENSGFYRNWDEKYIYEVNSTFV